MFHWIDLILAVALSDPSQLRPFNEKTFPKFASTNTSHVIHCKLGVHIYNRTYIENNFSGANFANVCEKSV